MNTILRNTINTLKRFGMATILNVLGLSVAFAAFIVFLMQVSYEYNFDKCHSGSERIFRVNMEIDEWKGMILPRPIMDEIINFSPDVEAATMIFPYVGQKYFSIGEGSQSKGFKGAFELCTQGLTQVFEFKMFEGDSDCLSYPDKLLIPKSMAHSLFGDTSAVGQKIHLEDAIQGKAFNDYVVGGVYYDFPENTQINNVIYVPMADNFFEGVWGASNFLCFLLLDDMSSAENVEANFNKHFDFNKIEWGENKKMALTPLTDIYFQDDFQNGNISKTGNKETTKLLFGIAVLIIAIAAVNYVNFSSALASRRIRTINTQKVLGCHDSSLRWAVLLEAVLVALLSYLLSIVYIWILNRMNVLSFIDADISLSKNIPIILLSALVALIVGFLAGLYPAYYVTSFNPALVLKGSFGLSPVGRRLRIALISFQYIISIALIICASFIWMQNKYMRNYSLGFDKDQIAMVELTRTMYTDHHESYMNRLNSFSGIEGVAFAGQKLGSGDVYSNTGIKYKDQIFKIYMFPVSWNFMDVIGIPVIEGQKPVMTNDVDANIPFYFNKGVQQKYDIEVGDPLYFFNNKSYIAGITEDVKVTSLRKENDLFAFVIRDGVVLPISYIRLKAGTDYFAAVEHIRKAVAEIDPAYPVEIEFYDTLFNNLYHKEERLQKQITAFCLLAVIISIVGVFGLVVFETEYRRKEIGIRKVFGADILEILVWLNVLYTRIVIVCFVIALPFAYWVITKWLERFAYKAPLYWWVFLSGGLLILAITIVVITTQSWKAAAANPIDAIKSE